MSNTGDTLQYFTNLGSIIKKEKQETTKNNKNLIDPFQDKGLNKKYMKYTKNQAKSYKLNDGQKEKEKDKDNDDNDEEKEDQKDDGDNSSSNDLELKSDFFDSKKKQKESPEIKRSTKEELEENISGQFDDLGSNSSSDDEDSDLSVDDVDEDDEDEDDSENQKNDISQRKIVIPKRSKPKNPEEIEQLKQKLKNLIEEKRKERQGKQYIPSSEAPKKDRSEESKKKQIRKTQTKKRTQSLIEKKQDSKKEKTENDKKTTEKKDNPLFKQKEVKPSLDMGTDIEFSTLKVDENGEIKPSYLIKKMQKKGEGKEKKLEKAIKLAEAEKQLIEKLKQEGGDDIVKKKNQERTLAIVRGEKIKDDPSLLKKSLKNLKNKKKKSYNKLMKQKDSQKKSIEERQKKRNENINIKNKIKTEYKKGLIKHKEMKKRSKELRKRKSGFEGSKKKKKVKK